MNDEFISFTTAYIRPVVITDVTNGLNRPDVTNGRILNSGTYR